MNFAGDYYFYRARYYEPGVGRFTQRDPLGFEGGMNFYSYVANNPVSLSDAFGLSPNPEKKCPCTDCAACVCCYRQILSICPNENSQANLPPSVIDCINRHEQDHISWIKNIDCNACKDREDNYADYYTVTGARGTESHNIFECSGHLKHWLCLRSLWASPLHVNRDFFKNLMDQIAAKAQANYKCPTESLGQ